MQPFQTAFMVCRGQTLYNCHFLLPLHPIFVTTKITYYRKKNMKNKLLPVLLILFMSLSGNSFAQNTGEGQMDEKFDGGKALPYGWFTEGWEMNDDDDMVQSKPKVKSNNGMGQGQGSGAGMGDMFGGDRRMTYLLTPPLDVKDGEKLVISTKKTEKKSGGSSGGGSGGGMDFDMKAIMGMTDTIYVVERSVYGKNQWLRVADFTSTVSKDLQDFTIEGTPAGKYRFRLKSFIEADVTEVKGFHIDNEAPDLLVTVDSVHARFVDYSVCDKDSTKDFIVINTGTGTLKVNISSDDAELFSVDESQLSIAAGDSATVKVTFHYDKGQIGKNEAFIKFLPEDDRLMGNSIQVAAVITDPDVWVVDFNDNQMPLGCYGEGFVIKEGVATHYNPNGGGMAAMGAIFGGGGASDWFMTPPLKIQGVNDAVVFSLKNGDGSNKGPIVDAQASVVIEKTIYGSNKWERVDAYQFKDTLNHVKWISWLPEGDYRFRFVSGDSLCIDSIAGGRLNTNAPDLLVRYNGRSIQSVNYGVARGNLTKTFQLINTGTSALQLYAMTSDPKFYTIDQQTFDIAPGESADVNVTFNFDQEALGAHQAALVLVPQNAEIAQQMIYLSAYITYENAWSEDFEPEYEVEEGDVVELPVGWSTTGWQVTKGGGMDMMAMMGMGSGAEKTWAPHTDSDAYELITPRLQAQKGDVLRFYADISSGYLNLEYRREHEDAWTYQNTYITADSIYFIAPYTGVYLLRFTGSSVSVDDFLGFLKPMEQAALSDENDDINAIVLDHYKGQKVNVTYDRVLSAQEQGYGAWAPKAYTICLPYEFRFGSLLEPGTVKFYKLAYVDQHYRQFIFNDIQDVAEAGLPYLVVVQKGSVNLNAYNVEMLTAPIDNTDERTDVNDYETMYFEGQAKKVGEWLGTFQSIPSTEADSKNMYCVREDGTWARFQSDAEAVKLNAFRGYFLAEETESGAKRHAPRVPEAGAFGTIFQPSGSSGLETLQGVTFHGDIPFPTIVPTDINQLEGYTIQTVDADGTRRYFDLQGREINGTPDKGLFIYDGKKVVKRK